MNESIADTMDSSNSELNCRVCDSSAGHIDVFSKDFYIPLEVYKIIMDVANVKIEEADGLPTSICGSCSSKMRVAYYFKQQCEATDRGLRKKNHKLNILESLQLQEVPSEKAPSIRDIYEEEDALNFLMDNIMEPEVEIEEQDENQEDSSRQLLVDDINNSENDNQLQDKMETCGSLIFKSETDANMTEHSLSNFFFCNICNEDLQTIQAYGVHNKTVHNEAKPYICNICFKGSVNLPGYERHMKTHMEPDNERVNSKVKDKDSNLSKYVDVSNICDKCNITFNSSTDYLKHIRQEHPDDISEKGKGFECGECGFHFRYASLYRDHMIRKHNNGSLPYKCTQCEKAYNFPSSLWRHMITHQQNRPFVCSTCGKGFNQQPHLKKHMRGVHKMQI